ncbi:hypothetical protein [Catellatospora chokoriensis]|uniref:Peptidase inhibitor family I36 n=1 Tax=Catellatospora chokoriensis TaxID=310353 RepID=A0A8J3NU29_9ACTN|nr:hypothetical protein [Catellatospora chokoriensis]GIF92398.1 hypothetical protein Cch02nite_58420 [Catellatospora chokoriensis]
MTTTKRVARRAAALAAGVIAVAGVSLVNAQPAAALPNLTINLSGSGIVVGTEWANQNYGGAYLQYEANRNCTLMVTDSDFADHILPNGFDGLPYDWDNDISSFKNWANCLTNHFDADGLTGGQTGLLNDGNVPAGYNDRTESIRWS